MATQKDVTLDVMIYTQFARAKERGAVVRIYTLGSEDPFTFSGTDAELVQGRDAFEVITPAITAVFSYAAISAVSLVTPSKF